MPFGLIGAPFTFDQAMTNVLENMDEFLASYFDDILVFSSDLTQHFRHLELLFERLGKYKLPTKYSKCQFIKQEATFVSHKVNRAGHAPETIKVKEIIDFKRPSNVTELRSFLGMSGFYRTFMKDYSRETVPLCELFKKKAKFDWTENCESAFQYLKEHLENPQLLSFPDFSRPFILQTDASDFAVGYMLAQEENNESFPVRFGGRVLSPAECRYSPTEGELLAIFYSVKREEMYLKGHDFVVYSDHEPLTHLSTARELINKRYRCIEYLEKSAQLSDTYQGKKTVTDYISHNLKREPKLNVLRCCSLHLSENLLNNNDIAAYQLNDKNLKVVIFAEQTWRQSAECSANLPALFGQTENERSLTCLHSKY